MCLHWLVEMTPLRALYPMWLKSTHLWCGEERKAQFGGVISDERALMKGLILEHLYMLVYPALLTLTHLAWDTLSVSGCIWNCILPYYIVGENSMWQKNMTEFTALMKELAKSTQMTYYFWHDSEVCIGWTLYYPMRPRERIYEWQRSNVTDAGRSRDRKNMTNVVLPDYIYTT